MRDFPAVATFLTLAIVIGATISMMIFEKPIAPNRGDYILNHCVEFFEDNTGQWTTCVREAVKKYEAKYG